MRSVLPGPVDSCCADTATDDVSRGDVTPASARVRVLPADYVTEHVELAYASTAHGVQGDTVPAAHVVIGDATGAASAYVGMTRGRVSNTAHLVAADVAEARAQWIAVFGRDRADLGPGHAAELAAREAARDYQVGSLGQPPATPPRASVAAPAGLRPELERRGPSLAPRGAALGISR